MMRLHKISKCLISLIVLLFFGVIVIYARSFLEKNKGTMNIIWRDFTKNGYHEPLEFQYKLKKNGKNEYITYELIPNETLSIELQGGERCAIKSSANVCYWIEELGNDIEIILYDKSKIEKIDETTFVVDKLATDGILAYQLISYDKKSGKMFKIISLDNIFVVNSIFTEIEMKGISNFGDILKFCEKSDLAYYDSTYNTNIQYYGSGKNGIYVRSLLTNVLLSLIGS